MLKKNGRVERGRLAMRRRVEPWPIGRSKRRPRVPAGTRIYAIGDIHGRVDLLRSLLTRIDDDLKSNPIEQPMQVFLGDYIDRGPASREVLNVLIAREQIHKTVFLKGNHETLALDFLDNPVIFDDWRRWGGLETLISYGIAPSGIIGPEECKKLADALREAMPSEHKTFLANLTSSYICGDFFFTHAGVRPRVKLASQDENDLIWIRDEFLNSEVDFGKIIVHGHTPVREPDVRANRINIDTGAYVTGKLTCLIIEDDNLFFI
jgi:serine/threonine protein phosphatase 1